MGSGSAHPPRLIELSYQPGHADRHVVLIGKGITFDSGGLSLKPNDGMKLMKTDMAGGAAVIGVMSALARLGVRSRVTGLVAAAENMPSGTALRVGDVITHYGGRTVEVLNTDAEGRLVLADALAYANDVLDPDLVVNLATLTGAVRVALGSSIAALFATDDELAAALLDAGTASGERLWRMPLADDYRDGLDSPVADLSNVSRASGRAGSIDAALFLREFAGGRSWAHLDIAGAARAAADDGENTKGATASALACCCSGWRGGPGLSQVQWLAGSACAGILPWPLSRAAAPSAPLDRGQQPVADREQHGRQPLVLPYLLGQLPDRGRARVIPAGVGQRGHRPAHYRTPPPRRAAAAAARPPGSPGTHAYPRRRTPGRRRHR